MATVAAGQRVDHSWPVPTTPLLGRERESAALAALLSEDETRLVTITGPGGVGKTRLALAVVDELSRVGADAVEIVVVPLENLRDPTLLPNVLAAALGVGETADAPVLDLVVEALRSRGPLLVLDNLEQIAVGAATIVARLLAVCPGLSVLATSRTPLRVRSERQFPLGPLPLPDAARVEPSGQPALALFAERARAARSDFALTESNLPEVGEICRRLDGLPLAIELAAARSKLLSPAAILARLTNRLRVLEGGARDLPARQQTMREAIAWSYDLLTVDERALFRRLAIFPGSFSLAAAEQILGDRAVDDGIVALVDHSLLMVESSPEDQPRARMLQPIRDVALDLLTEHGELSEAGRAHAHFFAELADEARAGLTSPNPSAAFAVCERDLPNFVAALDWFVAAGEAEPALAIAGGIWRFWYARGRFGEGLTYLDRALALRGVATAARRANTLNGHGALLNAVGRTDDALTAYEAALPAWREAGDQGGFASTLSNRGLLLVARARYAEAIVDFERAVTIFDAQGDEFRTAAVLDNIGLALGQTGDYAGAVKRHSRALAMRRAIGDEAGLATSLHNLAVALEKEGEAAQALALTDESRVIRERIGDRPGLAYTHITLGYLVSAGGDHIAAEEHFQESLALYRDLGQPQGVGHALHNLGSTAFKRGETVRALALFRESLALRQRYGGPRDLVFTLQGFAGIALVSGQAELAVRLAAVAAALAERVGAAMPHPVDEIEIVRRDLGGARFAALWAEGRTLAIEEAIAHTELVRAVPKRPSQAPSPAATRAPTDVPVPYDRGMTARELDVLRLIAAGKSNAEIGAALFISPFTAKTHVANLLGKLGVETRAAAATWAVRQGLV